MKKSIISIFTYVLFFGVSVWAVPNTPSNLTATVISSSQINLKWVDRSAVETGYIIQRSLSSTSGFTEIGRVGANTATFSSTGLSASTTYYYRVRAYRVRTSTTEYSKYSNITSGKTNPTFTYSWQTEAWSSCSATACGTGGTQTRTVACVRSDGVTVADSYCTTAKPATSQACSAPACVSCTFNGQTILHGASITAYENSSVSCPSTCQSEVRTCDNGVLSGTFTSATCTAETCQTVPEGALNVKNYGAKGDGITDDLIAFQKAVAAVPLNGTLYVPAGKYMFTVDSSSKYIKLKSNMRLLLDNNAILAVKPSTLERYYLIYITAVTNVEVSGGSLLGERDEHVGTTGEWGFGIKIGNSASKIFVHDMYISKFWGDGICIGGYANDVEIRRVISTENRRQGLSITRSSNIRVYDSEFSYTNGTAPQYGIDIEPDPSTSGYYARNIIIENNKIHHNKGGGIQAYKQTYDVSIKGNTISYNSYGIYTVESFNGMISDNTISHNRYHGVALRTSTDNYTVSNNIFRNNYTSLYGETNDTNTLTAITGVLSGTTTPHVNLGTGITNISIMTNQYAK